MANRKKSFRNLYKPMNDPLSSSSDGPDLSGTDDLLQRTSSLFTPTSLQKTNTKLNRHYTQKSQSSKPVNMDEFMAEFEQERRPSLPKPPPSANNNNILEMHSAFKDFVEVKKRYAPSVISYDEYEDSSQNFSDTARLTMNASTPSGFNENHGISRPSIAASRTSFRQERQSRLYMPAPIDPVIDHNTTKWKARKDFVRHELIHVLSRSIRHISQRIVNVHSKEASKFIHHYHTTHTVSDDAQRSSDEETGTDTESLTESTKMMPTHNNDSDTRGGNSSRSSQAPANTTLIYEQHQLKLQRDKLYGNSLGIFSPTNPFRVLLSKLVFSKWYETFMMMLILLHGIVLIIVGWGTIATPTPPSSFLPSWDQLIILLIFLVYTISVLCRIVVFGLIRNPIGTNAFLRHSWNRVDFISVVSYWIDLAILVTGQEIIGDYRRILVFKMMSAIILLRMLNLTSGSKVILNSLKHAAPLLVNVLFFVMFFFVIFGIIGVQSFKGSFRRHCVWNDPLGIADPVELQQYCGGYINMTTGKPVPYQLQNGENSLWSKGFICENGLICKETENPFGGTISFDNIFSSMLIVMIIAGVQSWTDRMYDMMDAEYFVASLYFVLIVIVMNFWLINLFIAVITEMFSKVREDSQHSAFTDSNAKAILAENEEDDWAFSEAQKKNGLKTKQKISSFQAIIQYMNLFWVFLVAVDLLCMAAKNNDMQVEQVLILDSIEVAFSIMFLLEILLRMIAQRKNLPEFFNDKRNSTDLIIALVTSIIQIPIIRQKTVVYIWLTGFQVLRIYRLVMAVPRLRSLMSRVLGSVYGLLNLSFFIVLSTWICSIIAYQLLEGADNDLTDGEEMRFFSIYNSFAGLYQLFSGENWTDVLYNMMEKGATNGNAVIHAIFLVIWFSFSNFVLVNMFIAVLMENFETEEHEKHKWQVLHFKEKTQTEMDKTTVVSRWNIYRYFKPKPKGLDVDNIPNNLVFSVRKSIVKEFMNGASNTQIEPTVTAPLPVLRQTRRMNEADKHTGIKARVKNVLSSLFSSKAGSTSALDNSRSNVNNRSSFYFNDAFEQIGTFYDLSKKMGLSTQSLNEPRSLRNLVDPRLRETVATHFQSQEIIDHDIEERKALKRDFIRAHPNYDTSLYIFSPNNHIRYFCQLLVQPSRGERVFGTPANKWASTIFLATITLCVIANIVLTIYNSPVYQFEHRNNLASLNWFTYMDWTFTIIFTIEFVIKVIADGLLLTPNSYIMNGWNLLDLFVLITLYMSNFGKFSSSTGVQRGFRAFKALRALRLINLLGPAKETFTSILVKGLPRILDAAALGICLIVPFALYGMNIFMGLFYQCNDSAQNKDTCVYENLTNSQQPMSDSTNVYAPRIWQNPYVYSFDSFWKSLLILFEIASGEGWVNVEITSMSITGKDMAPQQDASQLWGIFFMVYNLVGSVFVISLFLGVVIENFTKRNGSAYLTNDQKRWLDLKKLLNQIRPAKRPKQEPKNKIRKLCYNLVVEKRGKFYKLMTVIITLNVLFLCTDSAVESENTNGSNAETTWDKVKEYVYICFIVTYWLEITIKLLGLGWKSFRRNLWNLFDLVIVLGSFITAIIALSSPDLQLNVESQKLFMTALCFKLVQRNDSLNQLFTTMIASSYQIINVFAVWFIVLTTYTIMFMQIFGLTKYGPQSSSTEYINFRTWSNTMISLIRYSTGENWNSVMHDFTIEAPNCVVADNYLDSDCGSLSWAYFLFLSFNIISMYIFIAIFVAVVSENFSYVYQIKANFSLVNRDEIRKFKMTWATIDTERTGHIKSSEYMTFWRRLDGIFTVRMFEPEFSYRNLVKECTSNLIEPSNTTTTLDPYVHNLDLRALNKKLNQLDKQDLHKRRKDLENIYWETALVESTGKGVSFNQMLLMLAQRKLIISENALVLEELLENKKKEEAIHTLTSIDRVRGLIETIALRKKFLKHLADKRNNEVPVITVQDNSRVEDETDKLVNVAEFDNYNTHIKSSSNELNNDRNYSANHSISSLYDYYQTTDDEEEPQAELVEEEPVVEDMSLHGVWQEMLDEESNSNSNHRY